MLWSFLKGLVKHMPSSFKRQEAEFVRLISGDNRSRKELCLLETLSFFNLPITRLYVDNFLDKQSPKRLAKIVEDVKAEFNHILFNETDWMDDISKRKVSKKVLNFNHLKIYFDSVMCL